ncbi:uncharacterized protein LOC144655468 [Oculina patagonica]
MIKTGTRDETFPCQTEMDGGYENDELGDGPEANWSLIPSARSSQTVRRQEKALDIDTIKESLLWKSAGDHDLNGECTRSGHELPVGVFSKIVARTSSEQYDQEKQITAVPSKGRLPHPSQLRKRKRKRNKTMCTSSRSHHGFDVTAHVAQLKRKQAEFNWLPTSMTPSSCSLDEEPFPPDSTGPQCVPSTPTLGNETFELQSGNILDSWQLPTSHNSGNRVVFDLFNTFHQPPQLSGQFSIPSYAVARRERSQEEFQGEEFHANLHSTRSLPAFDRFDSRNEQPSFTAWLNQQHSPFSPENPFYPITNPLKEE